MRKIFKYLEKLILWGVLVALAIVLLFAFVDIVYVIYQQLFEPPLFIIDSSGLMNLFSLILLLLIGLELFETVKAYLKDDIVHVEFIILVAIIAIARKVIIWDFEKYSTDELLSLSGMILSLGITYFLLKNTDLRIRKIQKSVKIGDEE